MNFFTINIRGKLYDYTHPAVMGIINITPDSFYGGSKAQTIDSIERKAVEMIADGADIIDVGGYSTRPGCKEVSIDEELRRIELGIEAIRKVSNDIPVSVDTFRAEVARIAVTQLTAGIINDISGGGIDESMFETVAALKVPYVLTHSQSESQSGYEPTTNTVYADLMADIMKELAEKVARLQLLGVNDIIIDPGFGFNKDTEHNFMLLDNLEVLECLHKPIMVGISRKSMIRKTLGITAEEALNGTTVLNTIAVTKGAAILRVHDVREAKEIVALTSRLPNTVRM